jgi:hypothetical protein
MFLGGSSLCYVIGILAQGGIQYIRAVALQFFFCVGHLVVGFCFMLSRLHIHCLVFQFAFQLVLSGHGLDVSHVFYFTLT